MSHIDITAYHEMNLDEAHEAADALAQDLAQKFDIEYEWEGEFIHFHRVGVDGSIEISEGHIHIQAKLGLLLTFMQARIEDEIGGYLRSHFNCEIEDQSS